MGETRIQNFSEESNTIYQRSKTIGYAVLAQRCLFTGRRVASVYEMESKLFTV